jgi:hypothetical protein
VFPFAPRDQCRLNVRRWSWLPGDKTFKALGPVRYYPFLWCMVVRDIESFISRIVWRLPHEVLRACIHDLIKTPYSPRHTWRPVTKRNSFLDLAAWHWQPWFVGLRVSVNATRMAVLRGILATDLQIPRPKYGRLHTSGCLSHHLRRGRLTGPHNALLNFDSTVLQRAVLGRHWSLRHHAIWAVPPTGCPLTPTTAAARCLFLSTSLAWALQLGAVFFIVYVPGVGLICNDIYRWEGGPSH